MTRARPWTLLLLALPTFAACAEAPRRRPDDPGDLLSRYGETKTADDAFCQLVDLVCSQARFAATDECAQLQQICTGAGPEQGGPATEGAPADSAPALPADSGAPATPDVNALTPEGGPPAPPPLGTCQSGPAPRGALPPGTPIVYPAPSGKGVTPLFPDYSVSVGGKGAPVYTAHVEVSPGQKSVIGFTSFDVNGSVDVVVKVKGSVSSAKVLPSPYQIQPSVSGSTVTIPIPRPGIYELQVNGTMSRSLMIFANPYEGSPPKQGAAGVVYYGPGVHDIGDVKVKSNTTYYLAGGAIVHGTFSGKGVSNVTIRGRGIIDNTASTIGGGRSNIRLTNVSDITIEGLVIIDHPGTAGWMIPIFDGKKILVDGVKLMSDRQNSDGMDLSDCSEVEIRRVFVRSLDDGITIKDFHGGNSHDICAHDSVIASDWGNACLVVGEESDTDEKYDITFNNIDIIHGRCARPLSVWISGHAHAHDIFFRNITIEQSRSFDTILMLTNAGGTYATPSDPKGAGKVDNVKFENIHVLDDTLKGSVIRTESGGAGFDGVHFKGFRHKGKVLTSASAIKLSVQSTKNLTFAP